MNSWKNKQTGPERERKKDKERDKDKERVRTNPAHDSSRTNLIGIKHTPLNLCVYQV